MNELVRFVLQAGLVAKAVLLILFVLSVTSWAIIFDKFRLMRKVKKESYEFLRLFKMRMKWIDLYTQSREFRYSPFARIFRKTFNELNAYSFDYSVERQITLQKSQIVNSVPEPVVEVAISEEMAALEKRMIILATTVSVSPFLGLLGTVWGVMTAFLNMGLKGSADITAVGPGIAEALITTVVGLAVAIPALVAYNYLVDRLRRLENELHNFFANLAIMMKREKVL